MKCHKAHIARPAKHCIDCGKKITRAAKRCRACGFKFRASQKSRCVDCGKPLKQPGTKRCKACHLKYMTTAGAKSRFAAARATALKNRVGRTKAEVAAGELLKLFSLDCREQVPIGSYIVDFLVEDLHLVVEVHGGYWHDRPMHQMRDERRKKWLESKGLKVLYLRQDQMHLWFLKLASILGCMPSSQALGLKFGI